MHTLKSLLIRVHLYLNPNHSIMLQILITRCCLNIHYSPKSDAPLKMWVNDFDNNGTIEQVITQHRDGKDYPIHHKKEITAQLVSLKKQNLKLSISVASLLLLFSYTNKHGPNIEKQIMKECTACTTCSKIKLCWCCTFIINLEIECE